MADVDGVDDGFWKDRNDRFWAENPMGNGTGPNAFYPWSAPQSKTGLNRSSTVWKSASAWLSDEANRGTRYGYLSSSPVRKGLAVWDRTMFVPRPSTSVLPAGSASSGASNTDWPEILDNLNDVTPGLGGKRPSGRFVWDLMNMPRAWELANLAHVLVHKVMSSKRERFSYSQTANALAGFMFKVCMAVRYDLVMDMDPHMTSSGKNLDSLEKRGVRINMARQFRNPRMDIPCLGANAPRMDRDVCYVCGSAYVEPQPNPRTVDEGGWLEVNRWSCLPTVFCFAGWQTVDFVSHSQFVKYRNGGDIFWETPVGSLEPPSMFTEVLADSSSDTGDGVRYFRVMDYLDTMAYQASKACCPPLPCRNCMKVNTRVDNCPVRPAGEPEAKRTWLEYEEGMERIYSTCRKAAQFFEGRLEGHRKAKVSRRKRSSISSKVEKLEEQARRLGERAMKKMTSGFLSEARELRKKRDGLLEQAEREKNDFLRLMGLDQKSGISENEGEEGDGK